MTVASSCRAEVFDLDDTLHRERRFILSGYSAVALEVERRWGVPRAASFRIMSGALRRGERARAFQRLCWVLGLSEDVIPELVGVLRAHVPSLRLPGSSVAVLTMLKPRWKLGILTNGLPAVQASKIQALGLSSLVDSVVMADAVVPGGKPAHEAFGEVLSRLDVGAERTWFVGNDLDSDVRGAKAAGLRAVWLRRRRSCAGGDEALGEREADAVIEDLRELPAVLSRVARGKDRT